MTLITYISRVHFADGVLEVALSSELELYKLSRPLLVSEQNVVSKDFIERISSGIPFRCEQNAHLLNKNESVEQAISRLRDNIDKVEADVVVAFGSSLALRVADACCKSLSDTDDSHVPELFVIPGVDGIPTMSMPRSGAARTSLQEAGIQPAMVIIDPTLMLGESTERTASAAANALARCLSTHFSSAYNPPADGIAVEGFKRIARNISTIAQEDTLEMRRELMAASLNATLAMLKNPGIAQELCKIILQATRHPIDEGALMRLLIVIEAELMEAHWSRQREKEVRTTLGVPDGITLKNWLLSLLNRFALPRTLIELGLNEKTISDEARELADARAVLVPSAEVLIQMLKNVNLGHENMAATQDFA